MKTGLFASLLAFDLFAIASVNTFSMTALAQENSSLKLVYPPTAHQTTAAQIFFIGTAPPESEVTINDSPVQRSPAGHFAPSFPLTLGENQFQIRTNDQTITLTITRIPAISAPPTTATFAPDSLEPKVDWRYPVGEVLCFSAIANPAAQVAVSVGPLTLPLTLVPNAAQLSSNSAVLTGQSTTQTQTGQFQGCTRFTQPGDYGQPIYKLTWQGSAIAEPAPGRLTITDEQTFEPVEVISPAGVARTGPSTQYSRLTPLPQGAQDIVTARVGGWLRLGYGGWIKASETRPLANNLYPRSTIAGVFSKSTPAGLQLEFPLTTPVPISIHQGDRRFTLSLHNTTAKTDTIRLDDNPLVKRLDWQQSTPNRLDYHFELKTSQQWGYQVSYEANRLVLLLREPPRIDANNPLLDRTILIDPGHGGEELGARGPDGTPEKAVNLGVSLLLAQELERRGATVVLSRDRDEFVSLGDRADLIARTEPDVAISIHYNALPDAGNAEETAGVGIFWYQPQAHSLAIQLHETLTTELGRPSYGVFWNNLALTRPYAAPSVLLELGFMINPQEFEWIMDPREQSQLAIAIADSLETWFRESQEP
ncbi:MAG: N-acetylmuramoyl-L-alanine amidase [Cyanobacteria bacterium P01_H01_bin.15]